MEDALTAGSKSRDTNEYAESLLLLLFTKTKTTTRVNRSIKIKISNLDITP